MTRILAIDPGSELTGWVLLRGELVLESGKDPNTEVLARLRELAAAGHVDAVVIEAIEPRFGLHPGWETLDTARWTGRYQEAALRLVPVALLCRSDVLPHHGIVTSRRKGEVRTTADAGIRAALIDRYGGTGGKEAAIGRKASPGPLYSVKSDAWQALALGLTYLDQLEGKA